MKINIPKTKIMLFSRMRKWDVMPEISLKQGECIEVVEQMKIVGYIVRSDLKTISNTEYILKKAYKRMWILRRLKSLGSSRAELLDVMSKQVLSVLQLAVPAWHCMLTAQEERDLEGLLRVGLHIILGNEYISFSKLGS